MRSRPIWPAVRMVVQRCRLFWAVNYSRLSPLSHSISNPNKLSPFELKERRPSDLALVPFGTGCVYLNDNCKKFEPKGRLALVVGYSTHRGFDCLDLASYQRGAIKIVVTRDVRFADNLVFPLRDFVDEDGLGWQFKLPLLLKQVA